MKAYPPAIKGQNPKQPTQVEISHLMFKKSCEFCVLFHKTFTLISIEILPSFPHLPKGKKKSSFGNNDVPDTPHFSEVL